MLPYAYLLRFPLVLALALLALPVLALTVLRNALANLFVLGPWELFAVSLAAVLAAATILVNARLVLLYGHLRFREAAFGSLGEISVWGPLLALGIAWWLIGFAIGRSFWEATERHVWLLPELVGCALLGTAVALGIVWIAEIVRFLLTEPPPAAAGEAAGAAPQAAATPDLFFPRSFIPAVIQQRPVPAIVQTASDAIAARVEPDGYVDATGRLRSGHLFALLVFLGLLAVYAGTFCLDHPAPERSAAVPALTYLLMLLTLPTWAFAGAAFFLDRYRVPTLVLPAVMLLGAFLRPTDHFFDTRPRNPTADSRVPRAEPTDLVRVLKGCRLTAVAASGGGIRAAGWTAQVLTGLHEEVPDFSSSLRLLSTVSGGSVGAMYFVGAFAGLEGPPAKDLPVIRELALRSSLNNVGWAFTYPDLWRTFWPLVPESATDRSWAIEQAWGRGWSARSDTLAKWRDDTAAGRRPAVAFNATVVETGRRLVFGSFDAGGVRAMRTDTFEGLYPGRDVLVLTAARLSATFPYVTPVARVRSEDTKKLHMADGGYQDNYGVGTLVDWLDTAFDGSTSPVDETGTSCDNRLRIAVVLIGTRESDKSGGNRSWAFQLGAPLQTLLSVWNAGPKARNEMELHLLAGRRGQLGVMCFNYAQGDAPLSWHLSAAQQRMIADAWADQKVPRQLVDDFLHGRAEATTRCPS